MPENRELGDQLREKVLRAFEKSHLLHEVGQEELSVLLSGSSYKMYGKDEVVLYENEYSRELYLILEGSVSISKKDESTGEEFSIATLQAGDHFGELSLVSEERRSATITTCESSIIVAIVFPEITKASLKKGHLTDFLFNLARELSTRLTVTNEITIRALKNELEEATFRWKLGLFSTSIIVMLAIYTISIPFSDWLFDGFKYANRIHSITWLIVCSVVSVYFIKKNNLPKSFSGLTTKNWLKYSWEGIYLTIPAMLMYLFIKWLFLQYSKDFQHRQLLDGYYSFYRNGQLDIQIYFLAFTLYVLMSPLQELIARGCLQSSIQQFVIGSNDDKKKWMAILVSNLLFASVHSHLRISFVLAAFLPGLFWGWLFHRQKSLIGVSVSHILLGGWCIFVVGTKGVF